MSHIKNKFDWCLKKAEKELQKGDKHRGLIIIKPDLDLAMKHIKKAEHNLNAVEEFNKIGYSDWSASASFYSIYHCFLAILIKFGYESRNQECTFALISLLIQNGSIDLNKEIVESVYALKSQEKHESPSIIDVRESEQYGINLSLESETFNNILNIAKTILDKTKEILEQ